jgi:transposase
MYLKFNLSREELRYLYCDMRLTAKEIADKLAVDITTVYHWLKQYGIPRRNKSEARKLVWMDPEKKQRYLQGIKESGRRTRKFDLGKDELHYLYWVEGLSQSEIAKKFGVTRTIVKRRLKEYSIPVKGRSIISKETAKRRTRQLSEIMKQRWRKNPEYREKTLKLLRELAEKRQGVKRTDGVFKVGHEVPSEWREKFRRMYKGKHFSPKTELNSEKAKQLWKRKDYRERVISGTLKSLRKRPTEPEREILNIMEKHGFPFKYVGNGSVVIGRINPDFIHNNGVKKVIEVFGRAYHDPNISFRKNIPWHQQPFGRIAYYAQHGYDCLIIWDDELGDEARIVEKIRTFIKT